MLRLPPAGGGIFPNYDLALQAAVQTALGATSIPVARPIKVETDETWVGSPFFVMERAPGWVLADSPSYVAAGKLVDAAPETQARMQRDFVNVLADLHAVDWDGLGLGSLTPEAERGLTHDLARAETYVEWSTDGDVPAVIREALVWLRANKPDPEPPLSLIWGDPRLGNIVYDDDFAQVALLDWEMASIGPAELDLAWFVGLHDISARRCGPRPSGLRGSRVGCWPRGRPDSDGRSWTSSGSRSSACCGPSPSFCAFATCCSRPASTNRGCTASRRGNSASPRSSARPSELA